MKTSKVIVLAVGAAVLLGVAYYTAQEEEKVVRSAAAPTVVVLKDLTTSTLERIEIQTPDTTAPVVLTRKGEEWFTNPEKGYRADKSQITGIFSSLEEPLEGEVVSSNPESYSDFQVDDKSGTRVKLYGTNNALAADLIVGKEGPAAFTTYVRKPESKEVVNANKSLSYLFKKPVQDWRDKVILNFGQDTITRIAAEGTSGTFEIVKSGDNWKVTKPEEHEAQMPKVQSLLSTIGNLRAMEFAELETTGTLAEMGLDPPRQKLTITHEDRSTTPAKPVQTVLLIGNPRGDGPGNPYFARRPEQPDVALINDYQARNLSPALEEIAVIPPPPPQPETTATETATMETTPTAAPAPAPAVTETTTGTAETAPDASPAAAPAPTVTPAPTPELTPSAADGRSTESRTEQTTGTSEARH